MEDTDRFGPDDDLRDLAENEVYADEAVDPATETRVRKMRWKVVLAAGLLLMLAAGAGAYLLLPKAGSSARGRGELPVYHAGIAGSPGAPLERPSAVAVSEDGRVYVNDASTRAIRAFSSSGELLFSFNAIKDGPATALEVPVHIAVDREGQVYVTDRKLKALYVFDPDGRFLRKFPAPAGAWSPMGVAVNDEGMVFVTDVGDPERHRVLVFENSGKLFTEFGRTSEVHETREEPGSFYFPNAVAVRGDSVFVADSNNRRVQVFDRAGTFKYLIGTGGIARGIAFDTRGHLLVVDTLGNEIDAYDAKTGARLYSLGGPGVGKGQFRFPNDVAVDPAGRMYVADRGNDQVQVWSLSGTGDADGGWGLWPWALLALPLLALPLALLKRRPDTPSAEESGAFPSNVEDEGGASEDDRPSGEMSDIA